MFHGLTVPGPSRTHPSWVTRSYARSVAESPPESSAVEAPGDRRFVRVGRTLRIPSEEIEWRATTSGGPGGQHANPSNTRVEVRFDVAASRSLGPRQRARLLERIGPVAQATAGESRSQARNRQVALDRLVSRLSEALRTPRPRRATAPTKGSTERRLAEKRSRSEVKRNRARPGPED
jgi:ribosome-associated protein